MRAERPALLGAAALACALFSGCPRLPAVVPSGPCVVPLVNASNTSSDETPSKICRADSYNQMIRCHRMEAIFRPKTVDELQRVLREASAKGMHVRVMGNRHSISPQYCSDGFGIDVTALRPAQGHESVKLHGDDLAETWSSLTIHQLADELFLHDKSIGFSEIGFRDATVGGVLANGAHGSALGESTLLASRVRGVTLVNEKGELLHYSFDVANKQLLVEAGTPDIVAARASTPKAVALPAGVDAADAWHGLLSNLGMLGVVVRLDLQVEDAFLLWVRLKRFYADDKVTDVDTLFRSAEVRPVIPSSWVQDGQGCNFFQVLWYPNAAGMARHTNRGRLLTMCGVKIARSSVTPDDMARIARGKLSPSAFIMDDANWTQRQTSTYVEALYASQNVAGERQRKQAQSAALDPDHHDRKPGRSLRGRNVIDGDNAVLNPTFSGLFANFKSLGHQYMNAGWPFDHRSAADPFSCKFIEDVRFNGAIVSEKGGGALNGDDFTILGPSHRLVSSSLADEGHTVTQVDYELAIAEKKWSGALVALRNLIRDKHLCLPMTGVFIRFSRVDESTLLTHAAIAGDDDAGDSGFRAGERVMFLDFVVYAPIVQDQLNSEQYKQESEYHESYRLAAEMLMRDFGGRPHWGKNGNWWPLNQPSWCGKTLFRIHRECSAEAFKADSSGVERQPAVCSAEYYARLLRFQKVIGYFDPDGRFENDFAIDSGLVRPGEKESTSDSTQRCP